MARLELSVEINDESLFAAMAEVREKQRELNRAVGKLEQVITGAYAGSAPGAAVIKEKPQ